MRLPLSFLCVLCLFVVPTEPFGLSDLSNWWTNIKNKITDYVIGSNNGTLTEQDQELLERLIQQLNETDVGTDDFHARLKAIRENVRKHITMDPKEQAAAERMMKKFSRKIRQHIRKLGDKLHEVNENLNVSGNYYQGDIILTSEQSAQLLKDGEEGNREKRQAFGKGYGGSLWTTVNYGYAAGVPAHTKTVTEAAIKFWSEHTCINFAQTTATPRINVFVGQGCYSYVGRITKSGSQDLSLGTGCDSVGTAAHELGHALGFFHEQSRWDRDNFITLLPQNVQSGWLDQFNKETQSTNNNLGFTYDYGSVMQYAGTSAAVSGKISMQAKDPSYQDTMGSDIVSFRDVAEMNALYCANSCKGAATPCQNNGIPHPRDCTKCLCPGGFGGDYCSERPSGCGARLTATAVEQTLTANVGLNSFSEQDNFSYCNWMIVAPAGRTIQARITKYQNNACVPGCPYGGVEMKWRADPIITGTRYCCSSDVGETVTTATNNLPIIGFNRYRQEAFSIAYKYV